MNLRAICIIDRSDSGPCDDGFTAQCPHCGAGGRYINTILMEDGSTVRAMDGCTQKLFNFRPTQKFVDRLKAARDRIARYKREGWKLTSWDQEVADILATPSKYPNAQSDLESALKRRAQFYAAKLAGQEGQASFGRSKRRFC